LKVGKGGHGNKKKGGRGGQRDTKNIGPVNIIDGLKRENKNTRGVGKIQTGTTRECLL